MAGFYQVDVVLQKERDQQHPYVHSIIIRIGCHDYLVVTEPVKSVRQAESRYKISQFHVFKDFRLTAPITVLGFASDAEHSLIDRITDFSNCTARRLSLRYENTGLVNVLSQFFRCTRPLMHATIPQVLIVDTRNFGNLIPILDVIDFLPQFIGLVYLFLNEC